MDVYGPLLARALFPAFEAARGRPTVPLLRYLQTTERWSLAALRDLQVGLLRRLVRHAYQHTGYFRAVLDERRLRPEDFGSLDVLRELPLLDRDTVRATMTTRLANAPPGAVIQKATSGTTGEPIVVRYNAESRHWRDATRWRGYGWAGYRIGMRALHYWGVAPAPASWFTRRKIALDRKLKRDLYLDSTPRGDGALTAALARMRRFDPQVMVAYSAGAAALARFVNEHGLRDWDTVPVIVGAERLWPQDRTEIERAFGPAFETYGCREVMLVASECEAHAMHVSMEAMVVELIVREPDGTVRPARAGETGEVVITDLHNLACPMIRYVNGDVAVAHDHDESCACGRGLERIGPVEGRVTETLRDGRGNAVGGLVFSILFAVLDQVAKQFQVVQRADGSIVMRVIPLIGDALPAAAARQIHAFAAKYLPGAPFAIEHVAEIPLTAAGKRRVVVVEPASTA